MMFSQLTKIAPNTTKSLLLVIGTVIILSLGSYFVVQADQEIIQRKEYESTQDCSRFLSRVQIENNLRIYTVQSGDYLALIASCLNSTIYAIVNANQIIDPNVIRPGDRLIIPLSSSLSGSPVPTTPSINPVAAVPPTPTVSSTPDITLTPESSPEVTDVLIPTETVKPICPETLLTPTQTTTIEDNLFGDSFENNTPETDLHQWNLDANAMIADGVLQITSIDDIHLVTVPEVQLEQFSLEVDIRMIDANTNHTNAVIAFGNLENPNEYNFVTFNNERIDIYEMQNGRERFISSSQSLVDFTCSQQVMIVYRNAQIEIYVNGNIQTLAQVNEKGAQLGLGVLYRGETGMGRVYFDNLVLQIVGSS